ncbi:MAG: ATP-dependent helicase HrpB, partial [Synechococcus sp.]|nr:ATP-dependent helicase HrpB [Synechococcus sp.]
MTAYPIDPLLPELCQRLQPGSTVLLQAPPGAGKTTRVPLALIGALGEQPPRDGKIVMIEPRRLAAKAAATRLASCLDEPLGERIGFAVRGERQTSARTRVEVITDGLFLRRLQTDPSLEGVGCVLFDEFHERRRDADLAFTLLREAAPLLRPDLSLMLMSATLDLADLRGRLPEATVLESEGRSHPVTTAHQPPRMDESLPLQVLRAIEAHALSLPKGSGVLVFLPGLAEIERCRDVLEKAPALQHWQVQPLHGQIPLSRQSEALQPCPASCDGKVVLASAIAESSVTIDGVRLVIDSGLSRQLRYDPNTGMEGLETVPASLASADQRRGRAGRQGPGHCIRLWSPAEQQRRPAFSQPELQLADPQPLVMELALWGAGLGESLPWLDPPPQASLQEGRRHLQQLRILDQSGRLSSIGKQLTGLGVHPRLGLLMLEARRHGCGRLGCDLAALLSERDPLPVGSVGCDLGTRLQAMREQKRLGMLRDLSRQLERQLQRLQPEAQAASEGDPIDAAELVLTAFPQWLALERPGQPGRYRLRQGRGATLRSGDPLTGSAALAVARVNLGHRDTTIQLALPLRRPFMEQLAQREGDWVDHITWDATSRRIRAEKRLMLGDLVLRTEPQPAPPADQCRELLMAQLKDAEW